jgi:hypothetical protein
MAVLASLHLELIACWSFAPARTSLVESPLPLTGRNTGRNTRLPLRPICPISARNALLLHAVLGSELLIVTQVL